MTIIRRTISGGHHTGLWRQQRGWWVLDLWRVRLEFIRAAPDTTQEPA